jgi:hypothetical protein
MVKAALGAAGQAGLGLTHGRALLARPKSKHHGQQKKAAADEATVLTRIAE